MSSVDSLKHDARIVPGVSPFTRRMALAVDFWRPTFAFAIAALESRVNLQNSTWSATSAITDLLLSQRRDQPEATWWACNRPGLQNKERPVTNRRLWLWSDSSPQVFPRGGHQQCVPVTHMCRTHSCSNFLCTSRIVV